MAGTAILAVKHAPLPEAEAWLVYSYIPYAMICKRSPGILETTGRYGLCSPRTCQLYRPEILWLFGYRIQKSTGRSGSENGQRTYGNGTATLGCKKDFTDAWKYTVEDAAVLQQKYVISPWMDESMRDTYDNLRQYMDVFNKCGELCIKSGMKFGYHNHDFEFSQKLNEEKVFDIIMKNIDPNLVVVQLDIGNMYNGGVKALDIVKQYPGRFENLHVKDEIKVRRQ